MRSPNPTLPSITFVLSQAQQVVSTSRSSKRRGKFGVRRTKSSPSIVPHPPRYPPQLDSEFLQVRSQLIPSFVPPSLSPIHKFKCKLCPPSRHPSMKTSAPVCDSREKTVDYRFSNPPRAPSRSSFALVSTNYVPVHLRNSRLILLSTVFSRLILNQPKDIFDADAEIEIVVPSPTDSESPSTAGSTCSMASGRSSTRQRTQLIKAFMQVSALN